MKTPIKARKFAFIGVLLYFLFKKKSNRV